MFISATALTVGHRLCQLLQMERLALSSWNMEKDEMEHLDPFLWKRKQSSPDTAVHCPTKLRQWLILQPCYYKRDVLWMVIPSQCGQLFHSYFCSPCAQNVHLLSRCRRWGCTLLGRPGLGFGSAGACPTKASGEQTTEWSWSMAGRMLCKAWAVLETVINAQEASTLQGPH